MVLVEEVGKQEMAGKKSSFHELLDLQTASCLYL
jgi:hypothetical protein